MTDPEILKGAPEDSTIVFNALLIDKSLIESMGKTLRLMQPRSLTDIRRIVELEKDRDIRDLEQQAKGLEDFAQSLMFRGCLENSFNKYDADEAAIELRSQAKALKEQVKP